MFRWKVHFLPFLLPAAFSLVPSQGVWFHSMGPQVSFDHRDGSERQPTTTTFEHKDCIIFLHGRLEGDETIPGPQRTPKIPLPAELYRQFCTSLAQEMDASVLLIDYRNILASHLGREPTTWQMGPIAQSIAECMAHEFEREQRTMRNKGNESWLPRSTITLMTFSLGAAMGLKLLHDQQHRQPHQPPRMPMISKLILVEPVWRCWLPLVSREVPIVSTGTGSSRCKCLAIWGTCDRDTLMDSGQSVQGALRPLLPELETRSIRGGNHWYILNDTVEYATQGLISNDKGISPVPGELRKMLVQEITSFCKKEGNAPQDTRC